MVGDHPALPDQPLLELQAEWLAPARNQLLRRVHIARRRSVLDLGAGYGAVTSELARRAGGAVVAVDLALAALRAGKNTPFDADFVVGDARRLPFAAGSFDLVFSQLTLLWIKPLLNALAEIWRVLSPGGVLVAMEPDYGGMIEYPPAIASRDLWLGGLERAGANPYVGRMLPVLLSEQGFDMSVNLFDTLVPPSPARFEFLRDLPLTEEEQRRLTRIQRGAESRDTTWSQVAHLPFFLIRATKPNSPSPTR